MIAEGLMESHLDDDNLISNGLQGDREAFDILFARYRSLLYRLAYRILRNCEEAEDAVQNCSLLAFCKLTGFKHEGAFRSWLVRILVNEAVSILRKRKNPATNLSVRQSDEEQEEVLDTVPHPGVDPEQAFANKQSAMALFQKVSQLSAPQRAALLFCGVWGYTTEETSERLNVSPSAVRTRLFRARKQLAASLNLPESVDGVA
jgi:RNA polymerase sigma-70 factor (ECF subfamily)